MDQAASEQMVLRLDAWLDTMRSPEGYGGPVVHWWQDCLLYTGAGLDWRYEGIILGYLNLYERTGDEGWLTKARRAGDDLLRGQLPSGNYRNSSFEVNPYAGGTPHEAACDLALLHLARVLKDTGDADWQTYAAAAEKNLRAFVLGVLWDGERQAFRNTAGDPAFVPNKAATTVEALLAWAALSGDEDALMRYALPMLETIVGCQVHAQGDPLDGAIPQRVDREQGDGRYFPFYIARCIPALVHGSTRFSEERFLGAALRAMAFIMRHRQPDGSFPQVVYAGGRSNRYPQWVSGVGDILGAMDLLAGEGLDVDTGTSLGWLLAGLRGGTPHSAHGFRAHVSQREPPGLPDFRDLVGVCGWADKAFRYLTSKAVQIHSAEPVAVEAWEEPCLFYGREAVYREDDHSIVVRNGPTILYRWRKGAPWAEGVVCA